MSTEGIIIAAISFLGTIGGAYLGVMKAQELVKFRLEQLEKKVDKHNNLVERTYKLEAKVEEILEVIK